MARRAVKPRRRMGERSGRPRRKKISPLTIAKIDYVDYKDVGLLNKFVSDRAKLKPRFNSGNDAQQQRIVARAVKNAREMALLPYAQRLTSQRRERRGERGARAAGPPPLPTAPPLIKHLQNCLGKRLMWSHLIGRNYYLASPHR